MFSEMTESKIVYTKDKLLDLYQPSENNKAFAVTIKNPNKTDAFKIAALNRFKIMADWIFTEFQ